MTIANIEVMPLPHGQGLPLPVQATSGSAGADLVSAETLTLAPGEYRGVATGLTLAIPHGYEGQVRPRSGLALKHGITVLNAPGTIDADYRGEVKVLLINHSKNPFEIARGDRIAQLVISPVSPAVFTRVQTLSTTTRGEGGFGSTGTKSEVRS